MEFYKEKYPVAKKEHICHICGGIIKVGEKYSRETGSYDGFFDRCTCRSCYGSRYESVDIGGDYEYEPWSVSDFAREQVCYKCDKCEYDKWKPLLCPKVKKHYEDQTVF